MNEYGEYDGFLLIFLVIAFIFELLFVVSWYNLHRFKECYDNNFKYTWCENYKNY